MIDKNKRTIYLETPIYMSENIGILKIRTKSGTHTLECKYNKYKKPKVTNNSKVVEIGYLNFISGSKVETIIGNDIYTIDKTWKVILFKTVE